MNGRPGQVLIGNDKGYMAIGKVEQFSAGFRWPIGVVLTGKADYIRFEMSQIHTEQIRPGLAGEL